MKTHLVSTVLMLLLSLGCFARPSLAEPSGVRVGADLIVQPIEALSPYDLWSFAEPAHFATDHSNAPGAKLAIWPYDPESAPHMDDWIALAVVLAGFGDVAETPVGVVVWGREPQSIRIVEYDPGPDDVANIGVQFGVSEIMLELSDDGHVTLSETLIGTIR